MSEAGYRQTATQSAADPRTAMQRTQGARVRALRVALLAQLQRSVDEDLDEGKIDGGVQRGCRFAVPGVWAEEAHERERAGLGEQPRDVRGAAHVLAARRLVEGEVAVETVAQVLAVEQEGVAPFHHQTLLDGACGSARAMVAFESEFHV
jgi:hypothetical protein